MLQDLAFGRLENEYRPVPPQETDLVLCFRENGLLMGKSPDGTRMLPSVSQIGGELRYAFRLHGVNYYLRKEPAEAGDFQYTPVRQLRYEADNTFCYAAMTGWHLHRWYESSRFCGRCGQRTIHDEKERMILGSGAEPLSVFATG